MVGWVRRGDRAVGHGLAERHLAALRFDSYRHSLIAQAGYNSDMRTPTSSEVYQWPEFKAFAQRLGVTVDKPSTWFRVTMDFDGDRLVEIEQHYFGQDSHNTEYG